MPYHAGMPSGKCRELIILCDQHENERIKMQRSMHSHAGTDDTPRHRVRWAHLRTQCNSASLPHLPDEPCHERGATQPATGALPPSLRGSCLRAAAPEPWSAAGRRLRTLACRARCRSCCRSSRSCGRKKCALARPRRAYSRTPHPLRRQPGRRAATKLAPPLQIEELISALLCADEDERTEQLAGLTQAEAAHDLLTALLDLFEEEEEGGAQGPGAPPALAAAKNGREALFERGCAALSTVTASREGGVSAEQMAAWMPPGTEPLLVMKFGRGLGRAEQRAVDAKEKRDAMSRLNALRRRSRGVIDAGLTSLSSWLPNQVASTPRSTLLAGIKAEVQRVKKDIDVDQDRLLYDYAVLFL